MAEAVKSIISALNQAPFEKNLTLIGYLLGSGSPQH
jgi:hypothetical protein